MAERVANLCCSHATCQREIERVATLRDPALDREAFCEELAPHLADAMEAMGIEDADMNDGRMLADTIYCLGYRRVPALPQPAEEPR